MDLKSKYPRDDSISSDERMRELKNMLAEIEQNVEGLEIQMAEMTAFFAETWKEKELAKNNQEVRELAAACEEIRSMIGKMERTKKELKESGLHIEKILSTYRKEKRKLLLLGGMGGEERRN